MLTLFFYVFILISISISIERLFDELDVIQDDWIKMKVIMIYNRSIVDNFVPTKIEKTLPNLFFKKINNFIILDILFNT